jgi:hypothetical protein
MRFAVFQMLVSEVEYSFRIFDGRLVASKTVTFNVTYGLKYEGDAFYQPSMSVMQKGLKHCLAPFAFILKTFKPTTPNP